jgi:D-alanyl-D-alanine carboxypeptidase
MAIVAGAALLAAASLETTSSSQVLRPLDKTALRKIVESTAKELMVPGAVVILRTPIGDFGTTFGTTTFGGTVPVSADQHIRVGSNTKTWVGTVILQQVQEGLLKLDDPVSKFRSDVPNGNNITITHLLNMRSGLFNYSETPELNQILDREPLKVWTPNQLLALAFKHPPYFAPGAGFHYSNTNTVLLGLIAEKLEGGKPLARILQDRLFIPLRLKNTVFPDITSNAIPEPHPRGYMYGDNMLTMGSPPALPAAMQAAARARTLKPNDYTDANPSWGWAAGAGISSANDLVTWVRALVSGQLLNTEMQKKRLASVQSTKPDTAQYGLGIAKFGGKLYGHTGELPGFNSFMGHDPDNGVTLVVWTNLAPSVDGRDPASEIAKSLIGQIYAKK